MINKFKLLILGLPLFLISCTESTPEVTLRSVKKPYKEAIKDGDVKEVYSDPWLKNRVKKGWYEGHQYLIYEKPRYKGGYGGMVHSPNCPCYSLPKD